MAALMKIQGCERESFRKYMYCIAYDLFTLATDLVVIIIMRYHLKNKKGLLSKHVTVGDKVLSEL